MRKAGGEDDLLEGLVAGALGARRARVLLGAVRVPEALAGPAPSADRARIAFALALILLRDLLGRVPSARAYADDLAREGRPLVLDHGAVRTVLAPCGALPPGEEALTRILRPLGFACAETYPLDRLAMTGRAWRHLDLPEDVPQYFVSEFHPEGFGAAFRGAAERVLASSADPLPPRAAALLERLGGEGRLAPAEAVSLLPDLAACFDRHHDAPALDDYRVLAEASPEMAWIATEGNAFNHATDRVPDVEALAARQKALGRPMKDAVEVSATGRVLQTAYRADAVERTFATPEGAVVQRVPGSFFEFITRRPLPAGGLDLGFDTSNAQAIFRMTAAGEGR
ncbi:2-oxoadipate dioxygenase/decarboxylase family protein [Mesoterricola sediminis]|uniref:2-oxoadipate dioxygenase/decarboxylase n=1 Tax=Mesoterricola sediminis TaxID=2927980 RepID=A0AA48KEK4_9BACT|nr:DUF1338 family protein [Mesoterricola sediminis]BDU77392.1 DUF1338 domain-containing protein [Mesoterricola sediminis]